MKTILLIFGLLSGPLAHVTGAERKKLIEFGWDEPGTEFLRSHLAKMQATPFDGCVFHVEFHKPNGKSGSFTWQSWGDQTFTESDLKNAFTDLPSIRFGRFKENFLRFNTTPGKLDWFDAHEAVMANACLAARLARAGHCPGILFDIEQYEGQLFNYRKQRDAGTKSWELYATQVRLRGRQVMRAFQKGDPGVSIFLTFGYSLPWHESQGGKIALADCNYGLLAPFLDGMVEAAQGHTRIIDGHELSYAYKSGTQFTSARRTVKENLLPIVRDPEKYLRVCELSFGIWLDQDWRRVGWSTDDFSKNYFSPESFEKSVRAALVTADEYVWIYSETPRWWSTEGKVKLPAQYEDALRKAREK